ncbi:MAG: UDP-N-acetylglucosamine--N-acetylmuramyl-(pentapeptide) pyrophosphoryl-undecaprenol N-acetylglucosamine transferase [Streptococcus sp.]|nr:UDP-N-acetylglucosamine--N-acetylmuramyl-(pentapeptide) pyrophosphoryl-undecaprenol N-acetylglucosamine transferase [Streptococcus sp.]
MKKRILFTGGGTVGHVTLNLILMPMFYKDGWEIHYIGDKKGIEYQEIKKLDFPIKFHSIATGKLRRYFSMQNLWDVFKVGFGIIQSLFIVMRLRPSALFSKGGFVSVPPVIASKVLGVPVFIHESDLSMGLANKIAYRFATIMYTTFEQHQTLSKMRKVGAITKIKRIEVDKEYLNTITEHFNPDLKTILFVGGSAGAKVFNNFVSNTPELRTFYNIINITGDASLNVLSDNLYRVDYVTKQYQSLMSISDFVVTRGGSNTIFELLALKKLQLIVPLGKEASRGDQLENARYFVEKGYAKELLEENLTFSNLKKSLDDFELEKETYLVSMSKTNDINSSDDFYKQLINDIDNTVKGK